MRRTVVEILDGSGRHQVLSRLINGALVALILSNILAMILETEATLADRYQAWFDWFDIASAIVFGCEYLIRVWSCTARAGFEDPVRGRVRFALGWMMIVDLLAFAPSLLPMVGVDLRALRVVRVVRVARLLKLGRYFNGAEIIWAVVLRKRYELVASLVCVITLMMCSATLLYFVERGAQADTFGSIPRAMWWSVSTLTTVGYGDAYPITPVGKTLGAVVAMLGVGLFALPAGLLSSGFTEELKERRGDSDATA